MPVILSGSEESYSILRVTMPGEEDPSFLRMTIRL